MGGILGVVVLGVLIAGTAGADPAEQPESSSEQELETEARAADAVIGEQLREASAGASDLDEQADELDSGLQTQHQDLTEAKGGRGASVETSENTQKQGDDTTEPRRRQQKLNESTADTEHTEKRPDGLTAREKARIRSTRPATGGTPAQRARELQIARNDIVAEPVDPISKKKYKQLYKASAKEHGFARDWYVLAAVGKVESDHGANMGPSSAGALAPMQFLPSTWAVAGVDGNGDGVANIMDPEDAIPAAAKYLKDGGAPEDWQATLFTYNHAGWYVDKVLGVAEGYRRLAEDDRVRPYT